MKGPALIQEYISHSNIMIKVYVIDGKIFLDARTSISMSDIQGSLIFIIFFLFFKKKNEKKKKIKYRKGSI